MTEAKKTRKVTIVGGGLVGALSAVFFGKRGWQVDVFERRNDPRTLEHVPGRSINLAMSHRARSALAAVGLEEDFLPKGLPMYGRYVHPKQGKGYVLPYGREDQYILSVERRGLNEWLLSGSEEFPTVQWHFQQKLSHLDLKTGEAHFKSDKGETTVVKSDLILGCDGAYSAVRSSMIKSSGFNFSQTYIPHGYIELTIKTENEKFAMSEEYFHLWPRGNLCLIALPNRDMTFTVTLFAPLTLFDELSDAKKVRDFFESNFADATELIGLNAVVETFRAVTPGSLVTIKCDPHYVSCGTTQVLLLGDSAHAMVPFYGQGMNCGFEDCMYLNELLDRYGDDHLEKVIRSYSNMRVADSQAACDLAVYNYNELRFLAGQRRFQWRKKLDFLLNRFLPKTWIPLYSMVTFTRMPYSQIMKKKDKQDGIINTIIYCTIALSVMLAITVSGALAM